MKIEHKSIYGCKGLNNKKEIIDYIKKLESCLEDFDAKWSSAYLFLTETQVRKYCKLAEGKPFEIIKELCNKLRPYNRKTRQRIINGLVKND